MFQLPLYFRFSWPQEQKAADNKEATLHVAGREWTWPCVPPKPKGTLKKSVWLLSFGTDPNSTGITHPDSTASAHAHYWPVSAIHLQAHNRADETRPLEVIVFVTFSVSFISFPGGVIRKPQFCHILWKKHEYFKSSFDKWIIFGLNYYSSPFPSKPLFLLSFNIN